MRNRFPLLLVSCLCAGTGTLACNPPEPDSAAPQSGDPLPPPAPRLPPASWADALAAAIRPPAAGYATYDVDPFLAAVVLHAVRSGLVGLEPVSNGGYGFRLTSVPPGIPHQALGLQTRDVFEAINGVTLRDEQSALDALGTARNALSVTVRRDDVSFTLRYRLTEALAWTDALLGIGADVPPAIGVLDAVPPTDESNAPPIVADGRPTGGSSRPSVTPPSPDARPPATTRPPARPNPNSPPATNPANAAVRCASVAQCEIDRAHFQALVANPSRLESQARIVPAIRNDIHSGYKLNSIKAGSDLARLGFRNADKITHINGVDLTNEPAALALYTQMAATRVFRIRYERAGRPAQKTITVR